MNFALTEKIFTAYYILLYLHLHQNTLFTNRLISNGFLHFSPRLYNKIRTKWLINRP